MNNHWKLSIKRFVRIELLPTFQMKTLSMKLFVILKNQRISNTKSMIFFFENLDYHRDSSPRMKLLAFANNTDYSLIEKQRLLTNIDQYETVDADINELIIKPWCSRFCPRCYTYK